MIQKKTNVIVAGAVTPASPRDAREVKTPTAGAKTPSHGRSASVGVPVDGAGGADAAAGTPTAGGAVPPSSPTSEKVALEVDSLLDENLSALEKVLREAKDMSIGASEAAYEAAKIKFAELQMEKKLVESSRGKKGGDDDAAEAKGKGKSKREPGQEGDARIDPYNPKAGSLPPLEPEVYAIPKLALHNFPRLRTPEDFSRGVVFNRKRYQIGMLIWQQVNKRRAPRPAPPRRRPPATHACVMWCGAVCDAMRCDAMRRAGQVGAFNAAPNGREEGGAVQFDGSKDFFQHSDVYGRESAGQEPEWWCGGVRHRNHEIGL